ncbi:MAG TPA: ATP-binding protein [Mycobacteriales bacterium]|nr:ATP-binding protein [Mycobacteriales bacterium]
MLRLRSAWTLSRRLRAALLSFSALLVLAVVAIALALRQADRALTDQTSRILPARTAASQLLTSLVDQETGLRGYAITHDRTFLQPYQDGVAAQRVARAQLDTFIRSADAARLELLTVDAAITAWQQEYAELRLRDVLSGSSTTTIDFGRDLFTAVRSSNARLDAALSAEARTAQHQADRDRLLVVVVLGVTALVVAAAVVGLQRALRTNVVLPMRRLGEQVAVVSGGAYDRAIEPLGPPDLREVGEGVESMRRALAQALADVEERERTITRRAAELARSNADLEQFAYVASHDLQEPLRKVASFCQALEQRYGGTFDERGETYLAFAVDGAKRMQVLIRDLLTFSRVGRTSVGFAPMALADVVERAWTGLDARVVESGAELEADLRGREVVGDASLLEMLFSNLLGNAIKYRRPATAPRIRVTAGLEDECLRIDVDDDGIGIPEEYAEKVFVIFQRLHGRDEYEGTGIGLALCKKIVEFHGGRIGLRPSSLGGTCVSFTLPVSAGASRG